MLHRRNVNKLWLLILEGDLLGHEHRNRVSIGVNWVRSLNVSLEFVATHSAILLEFTNFFSQLLDTFLFILFEIKSDLVSVVEDFINRVFIRLFSTENHQLLTVSLRIKEN